MDYMILKEKSVWLNPKSTEKPPLGGNKKIICLGSPNEMEYIPSNEIENSDVFYNVSIELTILNFVKRAMLYVTRKRGKSIMLLVILLIMSSFVLTGLAIGKASNIHILNNVKRSDCRADFYQSAIALTFYYCTCFSAFDTASLIPIDELVAPETLSTSVVCF